MRNGVKIPRSPLQPPPCYQCPKIPHDVKTDPAMRGKIGPKYAIEWTPRSRQAWNHFWATKSGAGPEQDELSREVCGKLEQVVTLSTRRLHDPARMANHLAVLLKGG